MPESNPPEDRDRVRHGRRYRVVAVGLYEEEMGIADRLMEVLRVAGWPRPNRPLVIREALHQLNEQLLDKGSEDVFEYFVDRQARRLLERTGPVK